MSIFISDTSREAFCICPELEQAINEFAENGNLAKADRMDERIAECACDVTAETEFLVLPTESRIEYIEKCFNVAFDTYGPCTLTFRRINRGGVTSKVALYTRTLIDFSDCESEGVGINNRRIDNIAFIRQVRISDALNWATGVRLATTGDAPRVTNNSEYISNTVNGELIRHISVLAGGTMLFPSDWDVASAEMKKLNTRAGIFQETVSRLMLADSIDEDVKYHILAHELNKISEDVTFIMFR